MNPQYEFDPFDYSTDYKRWLKEFIARGHLGGQEVLFLIGN